MNIQNKRFVTFICYFITISIATLTTILPGLLLIEERVALWSHLVTIVLYLLLSESSQLIIRLNRQKEQPTSMRFYAIKSLLALVLIWSLASNFSFHYALILMAYEFFQFLSFSERYDFQNSLLQLLVATFFKAIVFNLIISLSFPYTFKLFYFSPYLFNYLLILAFSFLIRQTDWQHTNPRESLIVTITTLTCLFFYIFYSYSTQQLTLVNTIALIILPLVSILITRIRLLKNYNQIIFLLTIALSQLIFYLH